MEQLITLSPFESSASNEYYLEYMVRNTVCGSISDWVESANLENEKDDIEIQFLMARIAAGINFFARSLCRYRQTGEGSARYLSLPQAFVEEIGRQKDTRKKPYTSV